ncbi:MAG: hypothetical protein ACYSUI_12880 [Planctomycetota bacterium]|jgi:hypothetical protein
MNDAARHEPMMQVPTPAEAQRCVDQARRMFQRTLPAWVCDLLTLRRAGLATPVWTTTPGHQWSEAA